MRFLENIRRTVGTKRYMPKMNIAIMRTQQESTPCEHLDYLVDIRTEIVIGLAQRVQENDTRAKADANTTAERMIQDFVYGDIRRELIPLMYELNSKGDDVLAARIETILKLTDLKD